MTELPDIIIDTEARWRALTSPLRQRVLELLEDGRRWTVPALATALGRQPRLLYRHLDLLESTGIVTCDTSTTPTRYALAGRLKLVGHEDGGPFEQYYRKTVERMMAEAGRIHARPAPPEAPVKDRITQSWSLNLTAAQARKLAAHAKRFMQHVREALASAESEEPALTHRRTPYNVVLALSAFDPQVRGVQDDSDD
jgi:hypothetical protein